MKPKRERLGGDPVIPATATDRATGTGRQLTLGEWSDPAEPPADRGAAPDGPIVDPRQSNLFG